MRRYGKVFWDATLPESNSCELYFEESDIEGFVEKMERIYMSFKDFNDEGPGTGHFRTTVNEKLSAKYDLLIVDLIELR